MKTSKIQSPTEIFFPIQSNSSQGFPFSIKKLARNLEGAIFLPSFFSNSFRVFKLIIDTALSGMSENECVKLLLSAILIPCTNFGLLLSPKFK